MKPGITLTLLLFIFTVSYGQSSKISMGFWNVENLFDTIPTSYYDDADFTPRGRYAWTGERYRNKIKNLAKVIDDMELDILGLAEVENEDVVMDLVISLETDYNYIHFDTRDSRGLDLALLYKGDKFVPLSVRQVYSGTTRDFMYVRGELRGNRIDIVLCHMPSRANKKSYRKKAFANMTAFADSLLTADKDARLIIAGDFNASPSDQLYINYFKKSRDDFDHRSLFSPFLKDAVLGVGTYRYKGKWSLIDNILLSTAFYSGNVRYSDHGVFIQSYMLYKEHGKVRTPHRTFSAGQYLNGFSDHLPVYVIFDTRSN